MTLHNDAQLFKSMIESAAQPYDNGGLQILPLFIEKDYWICRSLQLLSRNDPEHRAVFKGGTSLTKAYNIGMRFSEDIDIAILDADGMTGNQLKKTIKHVAKSMTEGLVEVVHDGITSKGSHYHKAFYTYPQITNSRFQGAIRSGELLIEINSFGNPYPWEMRNITPFLTEFLLLHNRQDLIQHYDLATFELPVLDCRRTLTEKLVSLVRCSLADRYIEQMKGHIRHFYDLYHLMQYETVRKYVATPAFKDDFTSLLEHDRLQFAKPDGWQTRDLSESPLLTSLHDTWLQLAPKYTSELPSLAYREVPLVADIETSIAQLINLLQ